MPDELDRERHGQRDAEAEGEALPGRVLERLAAKPDADGTTLYLLGFAHSRAKSFPKAAAALERAACGLRDRIEARFHRPNGITLRPVHHFCEAA